MSAALALGAIALMCWPARAVLPGGVGRAQADPGKRQRLDDLMPALLAATVLLLVLGWSPSALGAVLAVIASAGIFALLRRMRAASTGHRIDDALPLTLTVGALLLRSGAPPGIALAEAATGCGLGASTHLCQQVERRLAMGEPAERAWSVLQPHPELAAVARAAIRTSDSGAALAQAWESVGRRLRAERRLAAEVRARKVGVRALAPLGLCFLPSFVCLGVIPMVIGLAADIL